MHLEFFFLANKEEYEEYFNFVKTMSSSSFCGSCGEPSPAEAHAEVAGRFCRLVIIGFDDEQRKAIVNMFKPGHLFEGAEYSRLKCDYYLPEENSTVALEVVSCGSVDGLKAALVGAEERLSAAEHRHLAEVGLVLLVASFNESQSELAPKLVAFKDVLGSALDTHFAILIEPLTLAAEDGVKIQQQPLSVTYGPADWTTFKLGWIAALSARSLPHTAMPSMFFAVNRNHTINPFKSAETFDDIVRRVRESRPIPARFFTRAFAKSHDAFAAEDICLVKGKVTNQPSRDKAPAAHFYACVRPPWWSSQHIRAVDVYIIGPQPPPVKGSASVSALLNSCFIGGIIQLDHETYEVLAVIENG